MKKSELKAKIKEMIMAENNLDEAKKKKSEDTIEDDDFNSEPAPDFTSNNEPSMGSEGDDISPEVKAVQDALNKAQVEAEKLGDKKLLSQIGNTITFFTRAHIAEPGKGKAANQGLAESLKKTTRNNY